VNIDNILNIYTLKVYYYSHIVFVAGYHIKAQLPKSFKLLLTVNTQKYVGWRKFIKLIYTYTQPSTQIHPKYYKKFVDHKDKQKTKSVLPQIKLKKKHLYLQTEC